jgi:hypothetical protein
MTKDYSAIPFRLQRKPPRGDVVRIFQRENETLQTLVSLGAVLILSVLPIPIPIPRFQLHLRKPAEDVSVCVFNESQSLCAVVAAIVKVIHSETVADAPQQKREPLLLNSAKIFGMTEMMTESNSRKTDSAQAGGRDDAVETAADRG